MKNFTLTIIALALSATAFAGTARQLDYDEQSVVARAIAPYIPTMGLGGASISDCQLVNYAQQGKSPEFSVECTYTVTSNSMQANATFGGIVLKDGRITSATFSSLTANP